jgi:hypothetical protein
VGRRHPEWQRREKVAEDPAIYVPAGPVGTLTAAFAKAAAAAAVTETLNGVRERSAAELLSAGRPPGCRAPAWPGTGAQARGHDAGHVGQAQRSDIDNAINVFASEVGGRPEPWS